MPELGVALLGATGVLGSELLELLAEASWVDRLVPLASPASRTPELSFRGRSLKVLNPTADALESVQVILSVAPRGKQTELLRDAARAGCVVIDVANDFADTQGVPVGGLGLQTSELDAVPEVGLVVCPGPLALSMAAVAAPLHEDFGLTGLRATALMSASTAGLRGIEELSGQVAALFNSQDPPRRVFSEGLAFDLVPEHGEVLGGWLRCELEAVRHASRLLGLPAKHFAVTQIVTPTFVGLFFSVHITTETPIDAEGAVAAFEAAPYVALSAASDLQTRSRAGKPTVHIGRVRTDPSEQGVHFWAATDPLRLAASNAVAVVEALLERGQLS